MKYSKTKTKNISFPLGGIGTGCIGLTGNGELIDWEIFNRPNKNTRNGCSHFAIRAKVGNQTITKVPQSGKIAQAFVDGEKIAFDVKEGRVHFPLSTICKRLEIIR